MPGPARSWSRTTAAASIAHSTARRPGQTIIVRSINEVNYRYTTTRSAWANTCSCVGSIRRYVNAYFCPTGEEDQHTNTRANLVEFFVHHQSHQPAIGQGQTLGQNQKQRSRSKPSSCFLAHTPPATSISCQRSLGGSLGMLLRC